jgi:F-type H+-transporting ATPase subunit delta
MAAHGKKAQELARKLFKLSVVSGAVSPERVAGVLEWIEAHRPANPLMVLRAYGRLVAAELARSRAVVEHAGAVPEPLLQQIAANLSRKYGRPVAAVQKPNPGLLAGLRVRLGDDVYEASVSLQLAALVEAP